MTALTAYALDPRGQKISSPPSGEMSRSSDYLPHFPHIFLRTLDAYSPFETLAIAKHVVPPEAHWAGFVASAAVRIALSRNANHRALRRSRADGRGRHGDVTCLSCREGYEVFADSGATGRPAKSSKMKHPGLARASRCKTPLVTLTCRLRGAGGFCRKSVTRDPCV